MSNIDDELAALDGQHSAIHTILDQIDAYRNACIARGYSEMMVEAMTVQYHWVVMQSYNRNIEDARETQKMILAQAIAKAMRNEDDKK